MGLLPAGGDGATECQCTAGSTNLKFERQPVTRLGESESLRVGFTVGGPGWVGSLPAPSKGRVSKPLHFEDRASR
jgi:hypothetical protein